MITLVEPPAGMELIPAGAFQMGDSFSEWNSNEQPVHAVDVNALFMDRYEVTNQQYADALNWAKNCIQHARANYCSSSGSSYDGSPTRGYDPLWNASPDRCTSPVGFFDGSVRYKADFNWPGTATSYQTAKGVGYAVHHIQSLFGRLAARIESVPGLRV